MFASHVVTIENANAQISAIIYNDDPTEKFRRFESEMLSKELNEVHSKIARFVKKLQVKIDLFAKLYRLPNWFLT